MDGSDTEEDDEPESEPELVDDSDTEEDDEKCVEDFCSRG